MRLSYTRERDIVRFEPYLSFKKDNIEFAKLPMGLLYDLTFISPEGSLIKGPELSKDEAYTTIVDMIKTELNDPSLEGELETIFLELKK
tara:strand:- start:33265 stop:33531 length:267 start_codon:yes stop_codon:yes gene_type:complete